MKKSVEKLLKKAEERSRAFTQFDVELDPETAGRDEMLAFVRSHSTHCERFSPREFSLNVKVYNLRVDKETQDALFTLISQEYSFDFDMLLRDEIGNFESEFPDFTIEGQGRSGGYLVLTKKKGNYTATETLGDIEALLCGDESEVQEGIADLRTLCTLLINFHKYVSYIVRGTIYIALTRRETERVVKVKKKFYVCIACNDKGTPQGCDCCGRCSE